MPTTGFGVNLSTPVDRIPKLDMSKIGKLRCLGTAFSKQIAVMLVIGQKLEISDWFVPTTGFGVNISTLVDRIPKLDMSKIRKLRCLDTAFSQLY